MVETLRDFYNCPISTPRLNALRRLHLEPINLVIFEGA